MRHLNTVHRPGEWRVIGLFLIVLIAFALPAPAMLLAGEPPLGVPAPTSTGTDERHADTRDHRLPDEPLGLKSDPMNVDLVGRWVSGECTLIDVAGDIAYCGVPGGLYIVDFSVADTPVELGRLPLPPVAELDVQGDYVYVATTEGLRIVDASAPATPRIVGAFAVGTGGFTGVAVSGIHAYVTDPSVGLRVIDASDPADPREVGTCDIDARVINVTTEGDYAYVVRRYGGLVVVDISDAHAPVVAGMVDTPHDAVTVTIHNGYAYVANRFAGFRVVDISDPANPVEVGGVDTPLETTDIAVKGQYAYVADISSFRIYDVSIPASPQFAKRLRSTDLKRVTVVDERVFVANGERGAQALDISDPSDPELIGTYRTGDNTARVAVSGDNAYVTLATGGIDVLDISEPGSPSLVTNYGAGYVSWGDIAARDHLVYAANGGAFRVLDVSDPAAPAEVGVHEFSRVIRTFEVDGDYAYVANGFGGFHVLGIANPTALVPVASLEVYRSALDIAVDGDYACILTDSSGLRVLDISTPASPREIGSFAIDASYYWGWVAMNRKHAYVTTENDRQLVLIDLADPTAPREAGRLQFEGWAEDVTASGDYVYMTEYPGGLRIVDVSDPAAPVQAGFYPLAGSPYAITLMGSHIYYTEQLTGLYILDFNPGTVTGAFLDVRPGSCRDPLPTGGGHGEKSNGGVLRAAVLGSDEFDVYGIDVSSLALAGATPLRHEYRDISNTPTTDEECACPEPGRDGHDDLVLTFSRRDVVAGLGQAPEGDVPVTLTGRLKDGMSIELTDCVRIVPGTKEEDDHPIRAGAAPQTHLGRATPNPFNPSTVIEFELAERGHATLKVYDVTGRLVATLVEGNVSQGRHTVTWSARGMASGVYFYRFETGDYVRVRKMVLLK